MDFLLEELGKVSVFLICAQMLLHFRAKDSYEKYIKLLISMMLLVLLVSPILSLLGGEETASFLDRVYEYEEQIQEVMVNAQPGAEEIETILQNITTEKLEQSLEYVAAQEQEAVQALMEEKQEWEKKEPDKSVEQVGSGNVEITVETIIIGGNDG